MANQALLNLPIRNLELSGSFIQQSEAMNIHTLSEVLVMSPEMLFEHENFSYLWLGELSSFLLKHGLLYKWQPVGGKIGD